MSKAQPPVSTEQIDDLLVRIGEELRKASPQIGGAVVALLAKDHRPTEIDEPGPYFRDEVRHRARAVVFDWLNETLGAKGAVEGDSK